MAKHPKLNHAQRMHHLGTLGTGNHFIEVCLDEAEHVWFMLHSGSRGVGNRIGTLLHRAGEGRICAAGSSICRTQIWPTCRRVREHFDDYVEAVRLGAGVCPAEPRADDGATSLRLSAAAGEVPAFEAHVEAVNCHHNYVAGRTTSARTSWSPAKARCAPARAIWASFPAAWERVPSSCAARVTRRASTACSHGAGRAMSRTEAKRRSRWPTTLPQTQGVECRKDADVIDETPMAYKSDRRCDGGAADLVEIVHTLRQVVCVKG